MDVATAFGLMTRFPVGWLAPEGMSYAPGRSGWCFPVVGAVVGGMAAAILWLGLAAGLPQPLPACWALAMSVLVTGGLHEDGLADSADGLGGGRTVERRLDIMRDSRIGSFGAIALALALAIRISALATMPAPQAIIALPCGAVLARTSILLVVAVGQPARRDGSGRAMEGTGAVTSLSIGGSAAAVLTIWLFPHLVAAAVLGTAVVTGMGAALTAKRLVGGYTGDILGATVVVTECLVLSVLAAR